VGQLVCLRLQAAGKKQAAAGHLLISYSYAVCACHPGTGSMLSQHHVYERSVSVAVLDV
jgi:hypothetical protein